MYLDIRQYAAKKGMTLRRCNWDGEHRLHIGERCARSRQQTMFDIQHHFTLNEEIVIKYQRILSEVDRAFDGVFNWHETHINLAGIDGIEYIGYGA